MARTNDEIQTIITGLREALLEPCVTEARNRAQDIVYQVLEIEHKDLRIAVRHIIRELVKEEVGKHLDVQVTWK